MTIARSKVRTKPYIAEVTALPPTVTANQSSVITAVVKEATIDQVTGLTVDIPVSGVTVFFSIPARNTGWPALSTYSGVSDGDGVVTTVYSPGNASPADTVNDTVQASLADGSSRAVVITRSAGTTTGYSITVTPAAPTVPITGGSCVIKANVKNTGANISGVTVNFATTAGSVSPSSRTTDANGNAETTFTSPAGAAAGDTAGVVTASITADGNEYAASVVVTNK